MVVDAVETADDGSVAGDGYGGGLYRDGGVLLRRAGAVDALDIERDLLHHAYRDGDVYRGDVELKALARDLVSALVD